MPSQPKGTRAYTDAASYNHHLAQHQAYTAQAQSQAANTFRNPYITPQTSQHSTSYTTTSEPVSYQAQQQPQPSQQQPAAASQPQQHTQYVSNPPAGGHRGLVHQNSTGQLGASGANVQYANHPTGANLGATHLSANVPGNQYVPNARARANTINQMDSAVPPALARLQHMNQDIIGGRNALTPVLNRDDAMREWERRQAGKASAAQPYPQLEYLQQQAEMVSSSGLSAWGSTQRYPPPPSKLSHAYQPQTVMVDDDNSRRDVVMSSVRSAARSEGPSAAYSNPNVISSPPQAYTGNATTAGNRYATNYNQNPAIGAFDSIDRRNDIGNMYVPMQPDQFQSYSTGPPGSTAARHVAPPAQVVPPSFYGAAAVPSGGQISSSQQRNPFQHGDGSQAALASTKDTRRGNGAIDSWQR